MQNVLADLALESEAATTAMMRIAQAYDDDAPTEEQAFARLATAVTKYWVCKRQPVTVAEALECLGGGGYVEESIMPRLFRESPLNGLWEGSGNVICLDVLRAMGRSPESVELFFAEVERATDTRLARHVGRRAELANPRQIEARARRIVERMAIASGLADDPPRHPAAADAFCAPARRDHGRAFGTLPAGLEFGRIVERARVRRLVGG
jgi:putative acyl-CoA dehydrogenase